MNELPKLPRDRTPPVQKRRLAKWMAEWAAHQRLCAAGISPGPADGNGGGARAPARRMPAQSAPPAGAWPEVGQVWLMHPATSGGATGPVYVCVAASVGNELFRIVPYGRFAEPALQDEFRTRRSEPFLRVLQLGRAADVPARRLACGWLITSLSPVQLGEVKAALGMAGRERRANQRHSLRTGPPLWSILDPRHDYIEEENDRLRFLRGAQAGQQAGDSPAPAWGDFAPDSQPLGLAAEDRDKYDDTR